MRCNISTRYLYFWELFFFTALPATCHEKLIEPYILPRDKWMNFPVPLFGVTKPFKKTCFAGMCTGNKSGTSKSSLSYSNQGRVSDLPECDVASN